MNNRKRHLGVVLGSGGARCLAHIGVLKALEEHHIPVTMVVGSSIGALIGGLYASGISVTEMETIAQGVDKIMIAKIMMPKFLSAGLVDNKRAAEFIWHLVGDRNIEDLNIPFAAVATDFISGREIILRKGPLVDAIMASIAIPTIFQPVYLNDRYLLDGGLSNPLPVSVAREMKAETILAVNVSPSPENITKAISTKRTSETLNLLKNIPLLVSEALKMHTRPSLQRLSRSEQPMAIDMPNISPTLAKVFLQSITIATNNLVVEQLRSSRPNVLLSPTIEAYDTLEFHKGREITQHGYDAAINDMPLVHAQLTR